MPAGKFVFFCELTAPVVLGEHPDKTRMSETDKIRIVLLFINTLYLNV
jgi:hypothetical protein